MTSSTAERWRPAPLDRDHPVPLHARLRDDLVACIAGGAWRAGQALPSESELTRRYGVSRITVRHALHELMQQGRIVKVAGRGSFVAGAKAWQPLASLQGLAEALAPQGHAIRNRVLALERQRADADVARQLGLEPGSAVVHVRRLRLLDGAPLSVDLAWLPADLGERIATGDLEGRDMFAMLEQDLGVPLGHADLSLSAVAAPAGVAHELGVETGSALLHVQRLTHDRAGRPVDHERLFCRTDDFEFRLRVDRQASHPD